MADGNRTTLVVAVAGIAATALVGIAGTAAAWLSARDDRTAQRELAREQRTYERRVAAYLDAIDFVEGQRESFDLYSDVARVRLPAFEGGPKVPYESLPPTNLTSRLRAFGSPEVFDAFQETQRLNQKMPITVESKGLGGAEYLIGTPYKRVGPGKGGLDPAFTQRYKEFTEEVDRFETTIHDEVG